MINAKDLRLGNWVKVFTTETPVKVTGIMHKKDGDIVYYIQHKHGTGSIQTDDNFPCIEGIPLSPEILDKIEGFNRETKTTISKVYNDIGQVFTLNKVDGKYFLTWGDLEVKTLHQLQNVYYFFTGTELIINL